MKQKLPTNVERAEKALSKADHTGYGEYARAQLSIAHVHIQRAERDGVDDRVTDALWERYDILKVLSHETL